MESLKQADAEIYNLILKERARQEECLEMIASENFTFPSVLEAVGSVLTNKYAEGYPSKRYYSGCEFVDEVETLAIERVKKLFKCAYANVQPHSGSQANSAVYAALLKPYDKILGMDLNHGGHLTHGAKVSVTGQIYSSFSYGVELDGSINYDKLRDIAKIVRPKLIICGFSAYTKELDFKAFRDIADEVGAILFADIAHVAGLIVGDEYPSPFPYADVVSATTHKTLRGPRGGIILSDSKEMMDKINKALFPGTQGGPLMHVIAGKAVGFKENLKPEWKEYAKQVKRNINALADVLLSRNFNLVGGGTENHLILMDLSKKSYSGKEATDALEGAGITANKNMIPGDLRSPFITSGVRLGSPALTSRGMKEEEFEFIGMKIAETLNDINNHYLHAEIRAEIKEWTKKFPIMAK